MGEGGKKLNKFRLFKMHMGYLVNEDWTLSICLFAILSFCKVTVTVYTRIYHVVCLRSIVVQVLQISFNK